jgi:hypothetical protein
MTFPKILDELWAQHSEHPFKYPTSVWVHIIEYKGEPKDAYGEAVELRAEGSKVSLLVHLFGNETREWRRYFVDHLKIEEVD